MPQKIMPNGTLYRKLVELLTTLFGGIAEIDSKILEGNMYAACNFPENLRKINVARLRELETDFSLIVMALMINPEFEYECFNAVDHERVLLITYQVQERCPNSKAYDKEREKTIDTTLRDPSYDEYKILDTSVYDAKSFTDIVSTIRSSYKRLGACEEQFYENCMRECVVNSGRQFNIGYIVSNFYFFLTAITYNDVFYKRILDEIEDISIELEVYTFNPDVNSDT